MSKLFGGSILPSYMHCHYVPYLQTRLANLISAKTQFQRASSSSALTSIHLYPAYQVPCTSLSQITPNPTQTDVEIATELSPKQMPISRNGLQNPGSLSQRGWFRSPGEQVQGSLHMDTRSRGRADPRRTSTQGNAWSEWEGGWF
jgi:hypothetical protein